VRPVTTQVPRSAWSARVPESVSHTVLLSLILLATALVYFKTLSYPFLFDDTMQIVGNRHIMDAGYVHTYFTQDVWSHLPGKHLDAYYRPLLLLWFRANFILFGDAPFYWHLTTILLHSICVALIYFLALRLVRDRTSATLAAALYAIHPLQVEGTAWISGVNGSLCAMSVLAAFLSYLEFKRSSRYAWLLISLSTFALALLAKESAIFFVGVILAYEHYVADRRYRWAVAYLPILLLYWVARTYALATVLPSMQVRALLPTILSFPWLLFVYGRLLILPIHLAVFYDFDFVQRLSDPRFYLPALAIVATFLCLPGRNKSRFFTAWFLLMLAPAFAYAAMSMSGEVYNGRQLCLPLAAFCIGIAAAATTARRKQSLGVFVALLLLISWRETRYWADSRTLFEHTYEVSPTSSLAATTYIDQLIPEREYDRAITVGRTALLYHPDQPVLREAVARVEFLAGRYDSAVNDYSAIAQNFSTRPDVWFRLGFSYLYVGNDSAAAIALKHAIQLNDQEPAYHYELGIALANLHRQSDAIAEISKASQLAGETRIGEAYARRLKSMQESFGPNITPISAGSLSR